MKLDSNEVNINEQIEYIYTFFKPEAYEKSLQLSFFNALPAKDAIIKTDREKIIAILTNLVKNAIKFTSKGSIKFGYERKDNYLEFFVTDTGIGIPKNKMAAIFDRFVQSDMDDAKAFQGAGLGLSISKAYVEMLGGQIWIESEEGSGSTIYFTIPINTCVFVEKADEKQIPEYDKEYNIKNLKILIAEDDENSAIIISLFVKMVSKEIFKVRSGDEAVEACRNNPDIDLVLMDIQLPAINGHEAARQIRKFNNEVIIIAQTAYGLSGDREKAIEAGCNDYISKPVNKASLVALIQKYFGK